MGVKYHVTPVWSVYNYTKYIKLQVDLATYNFKVYFILK